MSEAVATPPAREGDPGSPRSRDLARVEAELLGLATPMAGAVPPPLRGPVLHALGTRGKRLRPLLCVAAYRLVRGREPEPAAYRLACALEVVHTYSLVHDDLPCMDDDALRRGRPTVHVVFGARAALEAGAVLIPAAVRLLDRSAAELGLDAGVRARLAAELCAAGGALGMVGGQWLDLEAEAAAPADAAGLERIHRCKTGALLAASLRIGAIAAGADAARLEALSAYGRELGLAFQIVDDLLDVTATERELGKTAGKDARAGKATYPSLFGLERAREMARERIRRGVDALRAAGIRSPELEALAAYVLERTG